MKKKKKNLPLVEEYMTKSIKSNIIPKCYENITIVVVIITLQKSIFVHSIHFQSISCQSICTLSVHRFSRRLPCLLFISDTIRSSTALAQSDLLNASRRLNYPFLHEIVFFSVLRLSFARSSRYSFYVSIPVRSHAILQTARIMV